MGDLQKKLNSYCEKFGINNIEERKKILNKYDKNFELNAIKSVIECQSFDGFISLHRENPSKYDDSLLEFLFTVYKISYNHFIKTGELLPYDSNINILKKVSKFCELYNKKNLESELSGILKINYNVSLNIPAKRKLNPSLTNKEVLVVKFNYSNEKETEIYYSIDLTNDLYFDLCDYKINFTGLKSESLIKYNKILLEIDLSTLNLVILEMQNVNINLQNFIKYEYIKYF